jgi:glycosyltransferase involved in cell wall biosynthesis
MSARSVLLVSQYAPPSNLVAARRVAGLVKYLGRLGHEVTVLTSAISGAGDIEGATHVVRTTDLMASPLNWRRQHFAALTGKQDASYSSPSRLQDVVVPDLALLTWLPFALPQARKLARRRRPDVVITTSPPPSGHFVGRALRGRGVPWIAELRDGWTFEPPRPRWRLAPQRGLDRTLERSALRRAEAIVGVTQPIVDDALERFGGEAVLITNGFDPEEQAPRRGRHPLLDPDRHSVVHTGRLALAGVSLRPLLAAVRELQQDGAVASSFELVFAGPLSAEEHELLAEPDLAAVVRMTGPLAREEALVLQREADTLVVVTGGAARRSVATGKLFEYLAARRPILVLGDETEAARIVRETNSGFATSASDPAAIAASLRRAVEDSPELEAGGISAYSYPELARRYAELIERVVA